MYNLTSLLGMASDFIDTSDDDEAVELVATLYLLVLQLSGEIGSLIIENKLLKRDSDEEDDDFLPNEDKTKPDYVA